MNYFKFKKNSDYLSLYFWLFDPLPFKENSYKIAS